MRLQAREGWMLDDDERMSAAVIAKRNGIKRYEVDIFFLLITLRAKLSGAVYCYRSCLFVCGCVCLWVCYYDI